MIFVRAAWRSHNYLRRQGVGSREEGFSGCTDFFQKSNRSPIYILSKLSPHSPLPTPHSPLPTPHSPLPTPHSPLNSYPCDRCTMPIKASSKENGMVRKELMVI
ncbi:MAG: hypothetical protein V7K27_15845 [Nostoc sp.]|uniref:hypothetical protein n=1 Tax=Nostoc sp. TaxID=1180 RepID=UPI002FFA9852